MQPITPLHGVAAHLDLLRRFLTAGEVDFLVGELGLYTVHPDLERLGMSHSIRVMRPVLQQFGIPFAFGTVRHAPRNHLERFCTDGVVPGVCVATHDRDRHCGRDCDQALVRLHPVGPQIHPAIRVNFDPLHRNWRTRRARKRQVATAIDRLRSDA
ncbi:MAG: hypothetical protein EOS76_06010 [Mesorhizobium sp.]|nr:hypothetical protein EJ072_05970 [Mesorhizobium sp. M2A.F.Ca.ET.046.03.2.1]AZO71518.1 hypothetical protein EJ067_10320 [Mesorhizobium sp. M1D.F.Ca.ET.043.01.1.1]RVC81993.1 hypothetical protein EN766_02055 [Mesorhizobium sp. M2A.F.Ca.ET.046.02.1.1]RWB39400.1 MAG: hypothetical protein EOQ44_28320 [Mesorhizobium sp.]RWE21054.1 MAG: hypothetical protein EOS76_06010 [Mesorhizobium sp.]